MRVSSTVIGLLLASMLASPAWSAEPAKKAPAAGGTSPAGKPASEAPPADPSAPKAPSAERPASEAPPVNMPGAARFGEKPAATKPIENPLPQPATTAEPPSIDPSRFGGRLPDAAYGAYQRGLYKTAYNLALVRARNGDPAAQTLVAEILSRGLGVRLDAAEAAKWYQRAAEQGVPEAQFQYALMLLDGRYVEKDEKAAHALMQAAAEAGNILAQFNFAQMLVSEDPGDAGLAKAVPYYERAAAKGLADAQYAMAQIYANGVGGKKQDDVRARRLLVLAARQNYDTAQIDLGQWMIDGRGGNRDLKSGFGWTRLAADGGNVAAQNRLAKLYMAGIGVEPDSILAAAWYIVARRAGLIDDEMEDFMRGLTEDETKQALRKANRLR